MRCNPYYLTLVLEPTLSNLYDLFNYFLKKEFDHLYLVLRVSVFIKLTTNIKVFDSSRKILIFQKIIFGYVRKFL